MTGTETQIKAGSFGNIKDLLRKANGTDDSSSWRRSVRGRVGGESSPAEKATDQTITNEEPKKDATEQAAQAEQSEQPTQTQTAAAPAPSKSQIGKERKSSKTSGPKKEASRTPVKAKSSYSDFETQVDSFDKHEHEGKRHMVFIANAIYNTLQVIYGDKKISAVFNSLAQNHIDAYKDEMRNRFKSKSVLFTE